MNKQTIDSSFGKRLQHYRKEQHIQGSQLADMVNAAYGEGTTTRSVITSIETGRKVNGIALAETLRFAQVLKISPLCLILDLEQPFLKTDFPGLEGMTNYEALIMFTGTSSINMVGTATLAKINVIYAIIRQSLFNCSEIARNFGQLENPLRPAPPELGTFSGQGPLGVPDMPNSIDLFWTNFLQGYRVLIANQVIIPEDLSGDCAVFTEHYIRDVERKLKRYGISTAMTYDSVVAEVNERLNRS